MTSGFYYPGRDFTKADNPALPHDIRVLPSGSAYSCGGVPFRGLDCLRMRYGIAVTALDGTNVFIRNDGKVFVGEEEIRAGKQAAESGAEAKAVEEAHA